MDERHKIACCGVLYLVDQYQEQECQLNRQEQEQRIREHLRSHTYYDRNNKLIDTKAFRSLMDSIACAGGLAKNALEDYPDALWRSKSQRLAPEMLKLYDYDKETFDRSRLPSIEHGIVVGDSEHDTVEHEPMPVHFQRGPIQRSMLAVLKDIDAVKHEYGQDHYKYADKHSQLRALRLLIYQYTLTFRSKDHNVHDMGQPVTSDDLFWSLLGTFRCEHDRRPQRRKPEVIWQTGTAHFNKSWLRKAEANAAQLTKEQNLPEHGSLPTVTRKEEVEDQSSKLVRDGHINAVESPSRRSKLKKQKVRSPSRSSNTDARNKRVSATARPREAERRRPMVLSYAESAGEGSDDDELEVTTELNDRPSQKSQSEQSAGEARAALSRTFHIMLQDIDRVLPQRHQQDYKFGSRANRLQALQLLILQYSLTVTNRGHHSRLVEPTAGQLAVSVLNAYRAHAIAARAPGNSSTDVWMQGSAVFRPDWLADLESKSLYFTKLRGLPAYGAHPTVSRTPEVVDALRQSTIGGAFEDVAEMVENEDLQILGSYAPFHRSCDIVIQDIDRVVMDSSESDYNYSTRMMRLQALELLIRQYSLTLTVQGSQETYTPTALQLNQSLSLAFKVHQVESRDGKRLPLAALWENGSKVIQSQWLAKIAKVALVLAKRQHLAAYGTCPTVSRVQAVQDALERLRGDETSRQATEEVPSMADDHSTASPPSHMKDWRLLKAFSGWNLNPSVADVRR